MSSLHVTLLSYWAKANSLHLLHFLAIIRHVVSPLEPKLKHWICTIVVGHPLQTTQLTPSTAIKNSPQHWSLFPPLNRISISSELEHHVIGASLTTVVFFHRCSMFIVPLHNDTHGDELADTLLFFELLINMWIHLKRYFKILNPTRLSTN
jgi:hypothetical protein